MIRGLAGPGGIRLWSGKYARMSDPSNRYLRFESGFTPHEREVAILITARENDSRFEWAAHEPEARKEGVAQATIDAVKHRRPTAGLDPADALIIEFGREVWGARKVKPETFARLLEKYGPRKLVDLVSLMGNYAGDRGAPLRLRHAARRRRDEPAAGACPKRAQNRRHARPRAGHPRVPLAKKEPVDGRGTAQAGPPMTERVGEAYAPSTSLKKSCIATHERLSAFSS